MWWSSRAPVARPKSTSRPTTWSTCAWRAGHRRRCCWWVTSALGGCSPGSMAPWPCCRRRNGRWYGRRSSTNSAAIRSCWGMGWTSLTALTGIPVLGVVPDFGDLGIGEEDTVPTNRFGQWSQNGDAAAHRGRALSVPLEFHRFRPLLSRTGGGDSLCDRPRPAGWLSRHLPARHQADHGRSRLVPQYGFDKAIRQRVQAGAFLVGLCGGYQMLGERLEDPEGVESALAEASGLGFLPIATRFNQDKALYQIEAVHEGSGLPVRGYEIHMGESQTIATDDAVGAHSYTQWPGSGPAGWCYRIQRSGVGLLCAWAVR